MNMKPERGRAERQRKTEYSRRSVKRGFTACKREGHLGGMPFLFPRKKVFAYFPERVLTLGIWRNILKVCKNLVKKNGGGAVWTAVIIRAKLLWSLTVTDYAKRITPCVWFILFFANCGDKADGKRAES